MWSFMPFNSQPAIVVTNNTIRVKIDAVVDRNTILTIIDRLEDLTFGEPFLYSKIDILLVKRNTHQVKLPFESETSES